MEPALGLIGGGLANEAELELGLGLSLGSVGVAGKFKKSSNVGWGGGLILTAKDFSHGGGFQSSGRAAAAAVVSGTKRAAADSYNNVGSPPSGSSQVVGWPPIRAYRMNTLANNNNQTKVPNDDDEPEEEEDGVVNESKDIQKKMNHHHHGNYKDDDTANSLIINEIKGRFVKVNMDGIPIGRKVDLGAHNCYKTLSQTLEDMFFKSTTKVVNSISNRKNQQKMVPFKLLDGSSEFVLTYEDRDGDWMLVGDVPWGMFLGTVKRLRIMRTSEANGLAPSIQERHGRHKGRLI